jgi:hypothetical protein
LVKLALGRIGIWSNWHLVKLAFYQLGILSMGHFFNVAFCQPGILSILHFVKHRMLSLLSAEIGAMLGNKARVCAWQGDPRGEFIKEFLFNIESRVI